MSMMEIYSPEGTKVLYTGKGGYNGCKEHSSKYLTIGQIYTVACTEVYSSISYVYLKEVPQERFNTVQFESVDDTSL